MKTLNIISLSLFLGLCLNALPAKAEAAKLQGEGRYELTYNGLGWNTSPYCNGPDNSCGAFGTKSRKKTKSFTMPITVSANGTNPDEITVSILSTQTKKHCAPPAELNLIGKRVADQKYQIMGSANMDVYSPGATGSDYATSVIAVGTLILKDETTALLTITEPIIRNYRSEYPINDCTWALSKGEIALN